DRAGNGGGEVRRGAAWGDVAARPHQALADPTVRGIETFDLQPHVDRAVRGGVVDVALDGRGHETRVPAHTKPVAPRPTLSPPRRRDERDDERERSDEILHAVERRRESSALQTRARQPRGLTTMCARRLRAQYSSVCSVHTGRSLP